MSNCNSRPPRQSGPDYVNVMDVYVTNQCNLGCLSCFVDTVKSKRGSVHLQWDDFRNAIDTFMNGEDTPATSQKEIAIAGGEPFILYPLLLETAKYIQKFEKKPFVYIHTNGTYIKEEWIKELTSYGVGIVFSIDGNKFYHDKYRPFAHASNTSRWDTLFEKAVDLPKTGLGTNSVIRPESIGSMMESLKYFHSLGFKYSDLWVDYLIPWEDKDLENLEDFTHEFSDWYVERTQTDGEIPFFIGSMAHALFQAAYHRRGGEPWWKKCFRITLGADGNFYDCEAIGFTTYPRAQRNHAVNHASDGIGIDWAKRQEYMDRADTVLEELGAVEGWQHVCPRLYYSVGEFLGRDPKPMVDNLHRVSKTLFTRFVKIAARLRTHPRFIKAYMSEEYPHPCLDLMAQNKKESIAL